MKGNKEKKGKELSSGSFGFNKTRDFSDNSRRASSI